MFWSGWKTQVKNNVMTWKKYWNFKWHIPQIENQNTMVSAPLFAVYCLFYIIVSSLDWRTMYPERPHQIMIYQKNVCLFLSCSVTNVYVNVHTQWSYNICELANMFLYGYSSEAWHDLPTTPLVNSYGFFVNRSRVYLKSYTHTHTEKNLSFESFWLE